MEKLLPAVARKLVLGFSPHAYPGAMPFGKLFQGGEVNCAEKGFKDIDCFLLSGGTDIHPSYYNQKHQKYNGATPDVDVRDKFEWKAILYCKANNIPMIGICRGAQFLCVAAGGSLAQHVSGHNHEHGIVTNDGRMLLTTSVHHQMMNVYKTNHELLAWAVCPRSHFYLNGEDESIPEMEGQPEPEIVYFPEIKGLAIQGHPEYWSASGAFQSYCVQLVKDKLLK